MTFCSRDIVKVSVVLFPKGLKITMKSIEKLVILIVSLVCISGGTRGLGILEDDFETDFEVLSRSDNDFGRSSISDAIDHWEELKEMLQNSLLVCQGGMNDASFKLKELFDTFSEESLAKNFKETGQLESEEGDAFDEDVIYDLENIFQETAHEIGDEQLSILMEDPKFGKKYLRHVEKILRAVEHACSSLPKIILKPNLRIARSPEDAMRRTVYSLTKWTERWVDYIETRLDKLIDICIANTPCKPFLIKTIERLVAHLQRESGDDDFSTSAQTILQDLVNGIKDDRDLNPRSLSPVQKMVLSDYFDKFQLHEESAYNIAGNIHDLEHEDLSNVFDDALVSSILKLPRAYFPIESAAEVEVEVENAVHEVPDTFLSLGFDSSLIRKHWGGLKKKYEKLFTLASALSPSILRVGGNDADLLIFDPFETDSHENEIEDIYMENIFVFAEKHPKKRAKNQEILESIKFSREKSPSSSNHPKHKSEYQLSLDQLQFTDGLYVNEHGCKLNNLKEMSNFTMTGVDMNFLLKFVNDLDWPLLFDLNQLLRDSNGDWDPTNARTIMKALKSCSNKVIFQLGNEPNAYNHRYNWTVSPDQAAKDYNKLKKELGLLKPSQDITVIGPEVTRPRKFADIEGVLEGEKVSLDSMEFLEKFLTKADDTIDAITWHQYYMDGRTATMEDFMSPTIMNLFPRQLEKIVEIKNKVGSDKPIWITETASAYGGGAYGLSNAFVGGFLWLDKLGAAALGGVEVVVRQSLYQGCYALLDELLEPVPNYWISLLHKTLVGQKVLLPRARLVPDSVRIYAQCLNPTLKWYKKGAVVLFGINVSENPQKIKLRSEEFKKSNILKFDLTASNEDLVSRHLLLNGKLLELTVDGKVPELIPETEENFGYLIFKPYSMQFTILIDAGIQIC